MSTIAYRNGVMAADSQSSTSGLIISLDVEKCYQHKGHLLGVAGLYGDMLFVKKWFEEGMNGCCPKMDDESEALLVTPELEVYGLWEKQTKVLLGTEIFYAIGSGTSLALGAMAMGASAIEAIEVAIRYDIYSGGRIVSHKAGQK